MSPFALPFAGFTVGLGFGFALTEDLDEAPGFWGGDDGAPAPSFGEPKKELIGAVATTHDRMKDHRENGTYGAD